jgi:hypothetical protein
VPESGRNFEKTFTQKELASISGRPLASSATVADDLVGQSQSQVRANLREPDAVDGSRWTYLQNDGTIAFYVYFAGDIVKGVSHGDYRLATLRKK